MSGSQRETGAGCAKLFVHDGPSVGACCCVGEDVVSVTADVRRDDIHRVVGEAKKVKEV